MGYEVVRSLYQRLSTFDVAAVNELLDAMRKEALTAVRQGSFGAPVTETRTAYMRYVGQGHEIPVPLSNTTLTDDDIAVIQRQYDKEYARFFDRPVPGSDVEIMSYAVVIATVTDELAAAPTTPLLLAKAKPMRTQAVRDTTTGNALDWEIYDRRALAPGNTVAGPAIIAEDETSTLIGPGWTVVVNGLGYLEMTHDP